MAAATGTKSRKPRNKSKKKRANNFSFKRLFVFAGILLFFAFSMFALGYVVFFRTVLAQDIPPDLQGTIVFEEPDPPVHEIEHGPDNSAILSSADLPRVAIIIDDLGHHKELGEQFLDLEIPLTYAFLPFAPYTRGLANEAYSLGKTIFLHLPLEPKSKTLDPGPGALLVDDSVQTKIAKLKSCLEEVPHIVGINNHMGSLYTEIEDAMEPVLSEIEARSLFFVDSYTTSKSVGLKLAQGRDIKSARRHVFLDNDLDHEKICVQIEILVEIAERKGSAVGIGHPHSETVEAIEKCTGKHRMRVQYVGVEEVLL
jgi:polysaccharide deacetylase 2 family uncharacterized protein YibQ